MAVTPNAEQPELNSGEEGTRTESLRDVFSRLYADGRAYAAAEADRQKLRLSLVGIGVRNAAVLGLVALMLAFASIVALLVGLIIALSRHIEPLWATLIVTGGGLAVTIALLLLAKGCITRMKKAITP
ncbi:MAG: phage holin family protein [Sphingobium sp.]|nr:phage holin family protein [Sphingobium sp.]|tara:strand:+ start:3911 stop:4294 length:384 start_codon:yes stop_codon:yes gene_type:complete